MSSAATDASSPTSPVRLAPRPLSPHLQVYRIQLTSLLSITHRATGIALAVGTLLLVWWLLAAATGPEQFATLDASQTLDGGDVLPGFALPLRDLFDELDRQGG